MKGVSLELRLRNHNEIVMLDQGIFWQEGDFKHWTNCYKAETEGLSRLLLAETSPVV